MSLTLSRRNFLAAATAAIAATKLPAFQTPMSRPNLASDPLRPQCHFLPPGNWMNDPNGPIVWRGKVHLFYQVNPHGAEWGDISWGHAVSTDMVHWKHLPVALTPEPGFPDSYGVFSGSCIADGDRCLAFYTAVERTNDKAIATIHEANRELREQQTVAVSSDPDLLVWTKQKQALITAPPLPNIAGFRDPSVWREGNTWYMTVGSGQIGGEGMVLLYRATVPTGPKADWQYMHPLITAPGNGKHTPDTVDAGAMWECPDLFELDGHHVLLYSTERKVYWITGHLNKDMRFEPKQRGLLDSGAYYAPKSMIGPGNSKSASAERILWGWLPEKRPKEQYIAAGWSGAMSFPRVLHVDRDGYLLQSLPAAVDSLLAGPEGISSPQRLELKVPSLAAKVSAALPADGALFEVHAGSKLMLSVRRSSAGQVEINGEAITAPLDRPVSTYIDGSVIEVFFGDRAVHTVRAYPQLSVSDTLSVKAGGSAVIRAQAMKPVSSNRLTS